MISDDGLEITLELLDQIHNEGGRARICTKHDTYPDGREFVGVGILPDVEIHSTRQDYANGNDVVLERGLKVIETGSASSWASRVHD